MILIISPSKTLDFSSHNQANYYTNSDFVEESFYLIKVLRNLTISEISVLMNLSEKLLVR